MENNQKGMLYSLSAFILWGLFPLYWTNLKKIPALEIVSHRIIWSFFFLIIFVILKKQKNELVDIFKNKKTIYYIILAATFNCLNWLSYIYLVNSNRVLEASLGYFINPLLLILAGRFIFKETLSKYQKTAVILATLGVCYMSIIYQKLPLYSFLVAGTFTGYSIAKKKIKIDPILALTIETLVYFPIAILYLLVIKGGKGVYAENFDKILLVGAGVVTIIPLLLFSLGTKLSKLSSIGFFQYLTPTLVLLLGVFVFGENFSSVHAITFSLIWSGLIIYTASLFKVNR